VRRGLRTTKLLLGLLFLLSLGSRPASAQFVCGNDFYAYPKTFYPGSGCIISGTLTAAPGGHATLNPQLYQFNFSMIESVQGSMSGDLGQLCGPPSCGTPVTSFPCQSYTVGPNYIPSQGLLAVTTYTPGVHVVTATFSLCTAPFTSWGGTIIINVLPYQGSGSCTPSLVDPVAGGLLRNSYSGTTLTGTHVTSERTVLTNAASVVSGVAADGVAEVVVRVPANRAGDSVSLSLSGGRGSIDSDGGLIDIDNQSSSLTSTMTLTASGSPPTAFAVYRAPKDFSPTGLDDNAINRHLNLQVGCPDTNGVVNTTMTSMLIVRPPVELVHGLWSNATVWDAFGLLGNPNPTLGDPRFSVRRTNFSDPVSGITSTAPVLENPSSQLQNVAENSLGLAFNAPLLLVKIQNDISDFKRQFNVAAIQADVVGHSMGGLVARAMVAQPAFAPSETFGSGYVHKLITIGTPHLGTPLALGLLPQDVTDNNACTRGRFNSKGDFALQSAFINGVTVPAGVGDLGGDGFGGSLSTALSSLPHGPFPIAYIAGTANTTNLSGLDCTACAASLIRLACSSDPLTQNLTSQHWPNVFAQQSDAVVPLTSELNGLSVGALTVDGVIHTAAIEALNFNGPAELDGFTAIPDKIVELLNEAVTGVDFHP
jgi:pimeloyl-ACP methyl ester carboxylesterase